MPVMRQLWTLSLQPKAALIPLNHENSDQRQEKAVRIISLPLVQMIQGTVFRDLSKLKEQRFKSKGGVGITVQYNLKSNGESHS